MPKKQTLKPGKVAIVNGVQYSVRELIVDLKLARGEAQENLDANKPLKQRIADLESSLTFYRRAERVVLDLFGAAR